MPGSGLGSAREAMLMKYMTNWVRENAKARPSEIGGLEVISAIYRFAEAANRCGAEDKEASYMYRLLRIAVDDLHGYFEYLDANPRQQMEKGGQTND